ncbi:MAG: hypothetical protein ABSD47_20990 [Candidatus Methylomirabilota bacterium]
MTIFSVQRFLEDHFERRGLADPDQYAIRVANVFERIGPTVSNETLARELGRLRTVFFRRNRELDRREFEPRLAATLRRRFQKKTNDANLRRFERGLAPARARLRVRRRSIQALLSEFKRAVEARGVDAFWDSRKKHRLRSRPEKIAQVLLAIFAKGVIGSDGLVLREFASGIGFVDVGVSFGGVLHLIELKILKGQLTGINQLATYMETEGRGEGWLVLIDTRQKQRHPHAVPFKIDTPAGPIRTVAIDVGPIPPHAT